MRTSSSSSWTARLIASAQRRAREGGPSKVARKPSPTVLTSRPPKRAELGPDDQSCWESRPRQRPSPSLAASVVASTMSVNITVSRSRAGAVPVRTPGEELGDLLDDRLAVAEERERVGPGELDVARAGDVLGQVAGVAHVPHQLLGSVHHQRGHRDRGQQLAHVELRRWLWRSSAPRGGWRPGVGCGRTTTAASGPRPSTAPAAPAADCPVPPTWRWRGPCPVRAARRSSPSRSRGPRTSARRRRTSPGHLPAGGAPPPAWRRRARPGRT